MMKILNYTKSILMGLLLGLVILFLSISAYFYVNREEIKDILVKEINKSVTTKIEVKSIKLNFIDRFPRVSLDLEKIYIKSNKLNNTKFTDTLLTADNIYLDLNLKTIISGKPIIKTININNGNINILTINQGENNYSIFKKAEKSNSSLKIENIQINNTNINYTKLNEYNFKFKHITAKINLKNQLKKLVVTTELNAKLKEVNFNNYKIINKKIKFTGKITFTQDNVKWANDIELFNTKISTIGDYNILQKTLKGKINKIEIGKNTLEKLKIENKILKNLSTDFKLTLKNAVFNYSPKNNLSINSNWKLYNKTKYKELFIKETGIGTLVYSPNYKLITTKKLTINSKKSKAEFFGSYILSSNKIAGQLIFTTDLSEFKNLITIPKIENLKGEIQGKAKIESKISSINLKTLNDLQLQAKDLELTYDKNYKISKLNTALIKTKDNIAINNLTASINDNQIKFTGNIDDTTKKYNVTGKLSSNHLYLNKLIFSKTKQKKQTNTTDIDFDLELDLDKIRYNNIELNNLKGKVIKQNNRINLNKISLQTADGNIKINNGILLPQKNNYWFIRINGKTKQVDINKLFKEFNNFQQTYITSKNVYGELTSKFYSELVFDESFNIKPGSVYLKTDINITAGKLINYKPLESLSTFINIKELKNINFRELKNTITIVNNKIQIPSMEINSSAINLKLKGEHSFKGQINYEITVGLSEILYARFRHSNKNHSKNLNNNTAIILTVSGLIDNPIIKFKKLTKSKQKTEQKPKQKSKQKSKFKIDISNI